VEEDRKIKQVMVAYTTFLITQRQAKETQRHGRRTEKRMCQLHKN
jgi:hypothetical protein